MERPKETEWNEGYKLVSLATVEARLRTLLSVSQNFSDRTVFKWIFTRSSQPNGSLTQRNIRGTPLHITRHQLHVVRFLTKRGLVPVHTMKTDTPRASPLWERHHQDCIATVNDSGRFPCMGARAANDEQPVGGVQWQGIAEHCLQVHTLTAARRITGEHINGDGIFI